MDYDGTRVETVAARAFREGREERAVFPGAPAPGNCQRKSSRGAGAEPLQDRSLPRKSQQRPSATLSSYLRDNSDLENGAISLTRERLTDNSRVEEPGGTTAAEPEFLSECSPRDKPWDEHRADADCVSNVYKSHPEFRKLGERVGVCSLWLGFAWGADGQDENALTLKLRQARFCRVRLCPICQWRRALMWLARFQTALPGVLVRYPTARFVFLTLTLKNVPAGELRATLRDMNKAWERLSQLKSFRIILGWVRTTEVTRGKDGSTHPHFHALLMVPSSYFTKHYLSQAEWVKMWRGAARIGYSPVVDVRAVRQATVTGSGTLPAVRETLKYSVKPSDMKADFAWFLEVTRQVRNLRFIASGGVLKNVLREEETESEKDLLLLREAKATDEKASLFFNWRWRLKRYKRARPISGGGQ